MSRHRYRPTERQGLNLVQRVVEDELRWVLRRQPEADVGIDAEVEVCDDGRPTGRLLALQVKAGHVYFEEKVAEGYVYRGDLAHLDYWTNHALPVLLLLCDVEAGTVYWQHITRERVEATRRAWKITVPFDQALGVSAADALSRIAHGGYPVSRFAVPSARNPQFLDRESDLEQLHRLVTSSRPVGLTGMGGVGKTQVAVEYVHQHREDYPGGVYWANAAGSLLAGLAECAHRAGMCEGRADLSSLSVQRDLAGRLCRWLQRNPRSLLVLDNLGQPSVLGEPLFGDWRLPALGCHIIFTTRDHTSGTGVFSELELGVLPRPAALRLLLRGHSRQAALDPAHPEHAVADGICASLGDLPLAVEQAGLYLARWPRVRLSGYRDRLMGERLLTAEEGLSPSQLPALHRGSAASVLGETVRRLDPTGDALTVLQIVAEFDSADTVPYTWVADIAGLGYSARPESPDRVSAAVNELAAFSLVQRVSGDRLQVHPLVREFVRSLPSDRRPVWQRRIREIVGEAPVDPTHLVERVEREGAFPVTEDLLASYGFGQGQADRQQFLRLFRVVMAAVGHAGPATAPSTAPQDTSGSPDFDVFLCYNSGDRQAVLAIAENLRARGLRPWLDVWELRPGARWMKALEDQIERMRSAVVFVGPTGMGPWQEYEVGAILRVMVKRHCPVVPALLPGAPAAPSLPGFLAEMQWVDFRVAPPDPVGRLVWGITGERPDSGKQGLGRREESMHMTSRVFVGFSSTDLHYYRLMQAWKANEGIDFDFVNCQLQNEVDSENEVYIKRLCRQRLTLAGTFIQLIGEDTRRKHKYVRWEAQVAIEQGMRIIGVNLNGSRRVDDRCPPVIRDIGAIFVPFSPKIVQYALDHYKMHDNGAYHYQDGVYRSLGYAA